MNWIFNTLKGPKQTPHLQVGLRYKYKSGDVEFRDVSIPYTPIDFNDHLAFLTDILECIEANNRAIELNDANEVIRTYGNYQDSIYQKYGVTFYLPTVARYEEMVLTRANVEMSTMLWIDEQGNKYECKPDRTISTTD